MENNNITYAQSIIPYSLISKEVNGLYGTNLLAEMGKIIKLYDIYETGADFNIEAIEDYEQSQLKYKTIKTLIDKESRFMFSKTPDMSVEVLDYEKSEKAKDDNTILQELINSVMKKNNISKKLIQAAKDCFIGKRVALIANFNDDGISLNFIPSLEFVFDVDEANYEKLTKIVAFYTMKDDRTKSNQRIYKKKYWLENGVCWFEEAIYDGVGRLVEDISPPTKTLFTYIPAYVIINDSLTGDLSGVSEVELLKDYESSYNKLANADIDSERKSMNPVTYAIDMSVSSTKNLSRAAGSFWDLTSDINLSDAGSSNGKVGMLESSMSYSSALDTTLKRIEKSMYKLIDMPNVEDIQAQISSGKALKSIYWGLIVRCDEKMLVWKAALEFICRCIIDGAILYPNSNTYMKEKIPNVQYEVNVENQYSLPEDELEEIQSDIIKVNSQTMSKKRFMKKWEGLTDEEADLELEQIAKERELLEDSYSGINI